MSENVVLLPGVQRASRGVDVAAVLAGAAEFHETDGFQSVVVVGRGRDGTVEIFSSSGDIDAVIGLLMAACMRSAKTSGLVDAGEPA
jgi:hypothetical protein